MPSRAVEWLLLSMNQPAHREVLECARPLALSDLVRGRKSGRGLPQSKTLARQRPPRCGSWSQCMRESERRLLVNLTRFQNVTNRYAHLRIAIIGDFCLDRYLEVDPNKEEISIETGLPVHNVVDVRSQPGGAGTILNNLSALGAGYIYPVGFCGEDGEGFELKRALRERTGVYLDYFLQTPLRRTFTYCKPLLMHTHRPPEELNRLDRKNWSPTPALVQGQIIDSALKLAEANAFVLLDQVDTPETGAVTRKVLEA